MLSLGEIAYLLKNSLFIKDGVGKNIFIISLENMSFEYKASSMIFFSIAIFISSFNVSWKESVSFSSHGV